jgi:hypothetical protein
LDGRQEGQLNIDTNVRTYLEGASASAGRTPNARYASFDYCFNYFQSFRDSGNTSAIANPDNIQLSCLQLGFYLASWGMLRGSSDLLQRSVRHLIPVVEAIANTATVFWEIDADAYTEANIELLLAQAVILGRANGSMTDTLVTKVMLGVFGNVPAFDTNVGRGFKRVLGLAGFGPEALRSIGAFYHENAELLGKWRVPTIEFASGQPTRRLYTRAKVIDMAFFVEGMPDGAGRLADVSRRGRQSSQTGVSRAAAHPPLIPAKAHERQGVPALRVTPVVDTIKRRFQEAGPAARVPLLEGGSFTAEMTPDGVRVSNLGTQPLLPWAVFEETIALLSRNGGRASRGDAMNHKLGDDELSVDSVEGHIAVMVYGQVEGDSVFRRITPVACIPHLGGDLRT